MKRLKVIAAGLALLTWSGEVLAQDERDALRYSELMFGGTARIQGIAGAQTALGADASTMHANPAGLGLYRKSEITFSPGVNFNNTESTLYGTTTPDSRNIFNIPQFGFVFTSRKPEEVISKWRSGSFGFGFTRLNSFQMRTSYEATTTDDKSLLQSFQDNIKKFGITKAQLDAEYGTNADNITTLEGLAYATYLIDIDSSSVPPVPFVPARVGPVNQRESIFSRGSQNQWDFSYGGSYMDKLFIGGSIGLMTVHYEQDRTYTETSSLQEPYLNNFTLNDYFKTTGAGINFKAGLIYKPTDAFRIGASIQTPTFMSLSDFFTASLTANYKSNGQFSARTLDGIFDYELTTPFRTSGGLAYFIGKYGFISGDIEYVDYGNASFSIEDNNPYGIAPGTGYFSEVNRRIDNQYQGAVNYRIGAEARFDVFRVRAGFASYGDPYRNSNVDRGRKFITGGIGLKEKQFFIDAAYVYSYYTNFYQPYALNDNSQPVVSTKVQNSSFVVTAGYSF